MLSNYQSQSPLHVHFFRSPFLLLRSSTSSDDPLLGSIAQLRIPDMQFSSQPMPMLQGQSKEAKLEEDEEGFKEITMRCPKSVSSKVKGRCLLHRRRDRGHRAHTGAVCRQSASRYQAVTVMMMYGHWRWRHVQTPM